MRAAERRRTMRWPWVLALLIVAVASIPGVALLVDSQRDRGGTALPQAPGVSTSPSPDITATMGPQGCAAERPDVGTPLPRNLPTTDGGDSTLPERPFFHDPSGFRISVFPGWSRFEIGSLVCFRETRGARVLAVDQRDVSVNDSVAEARRGEAAWVAAAGMDSYKQLRLGPKDFFGAGAELEYEYVDPTGEPMHGMNLYVSTPKRFYTIYWVATQSDWPSQRENYLNLTIGFRPAP